MMKILTKSFSKRAAPPSQTRKQVFWKHFKCPDRAISNRFFLKKYHDLVSFPTPKKPFGVFKEFVQRGGIWTQSVARELTPGQVFSKSWQISHLFRGALFCWANLALNLTSISRCPLFSANLALNLGLNLALNLGLNPTLKRISHWISGWISHWISG